MLAYGDLFLAVMRADVDRRTIGIAEGFVLFLAHLHLFLELFLFVNETSFFEIGILSDFS